MAKAKSKAKTTVKTQAKPSAKAKANAPGPSGPPPAYALGEIAIFGFNFAPSFPPDTFAPCNGGLMAISQNQALFALLGTAYGGNGVTTFAVPKLQPLTPAGPFYFICTNGAYPQR